MKNKDTIIQPNHILTARYNLSALESNIIVAIIDKLQYKMNKNLNQIFTEQEITIELKSIQNNNNHRRIYSAIKSLGSKHVEYEYLIPGTGKVSETTTCLVSGASHIKNSTLITLKIPSDAFRFFSYIGGGFTSYQKTIAIKLNSTYSKKFYILCRRWLDKGGYYTSIENLKKEINIDNKYKKISHFKTKVLLVAQEELKEKADVFFTFSLIKIGRSYKNIKIKIHENSLIKEKYIGVKSENYVSVYNFLNIFFPNYKDNKALVFSEQLATLGNIDSANGRFKRLLNDYISGKKDKNDIVNLLKHVILPEFGIKFQKTTQSYLSGF